MIVFNYRWSRDELIGIGNNQFTVFKTLVSGRALRGV